MMKRASLSLAAVLLLVAGCSADADQRDSVADDELRAPTPVVELTLERNGKCKMSGENPRVKYNRVVRLKNAGDKPIAALVQLVDNFGGMPAPEGGDIEPGKTISIKMDTKFWIHLDDPEAREWSTEIVCKKGPWEDDSVDFDEVGQVTVYR